MRIVNRVIVDGLSTKNVSDTENISNGMLCRWIKSYLELGEKALENKRKASYGYRRINAIILRDTGWKVSNNLVHKVCKLNNINSKARHYKYKKVLKSP